MRLIIGEVAFGWGKGGSLRFALRSAVQGHASSLLGLGGSGCSSLWCPLPCGVSFVMRLDLEIPAISIFVIFLLLADCRFKETHLSSLFALQTLMY